MPLSNKEIIESQVTRQIETSNVMTQLAISRSGKMMFGGTVTGQIRAFKYPLSNETGNYIEHQAHSLAITKFKIAYDDQYLFSASEDGCIFVFKIADKDERSMKKEKIAVVSDEVSQLNIQSVIPIILIAI
jgi:cilia- and flagella-associated protein 57